MRARNYVSLKKPVLSEKTYMQSQFGNVYTFEVEREATKLEIKRDIEKMFNVKVSAVRTMIGSDKKKRMGKYSGVIKGKKKALVTLEDGYTLDFWGDASGDSGAEVVPEENKKETKAKEKQDKKEAKTKKVEESKKEKVETKPKNEKKVETPKVVDSKKGDK